jgi:hypothetical protein
VTMFVSTVVRSMILLRTPRRVVVGTSAGTVPVRTFAAAVGDQLPSIELYHTFPPKKVNLRDRIYAADKSVVLLGFRPAGRIYSHDASTHG